MIPPHPSSTEASAFMAEGFSYTRESATRWTFSGPNGGWRIFAFRAIPGVIEIQTVRKWNHAQRTLKMVPIDEAFSETLRIARRYVREYGNIDKPGPTPGNSPPDKEHKEA